MNLLKKIEFLSCRYEYLIAPHGKRMEREQKLKNKMTEMLVEHNNEKLQNEYNHRNAK